jgi:hypothetical protein
MHVHGHTSSHPPCMCTHTHPLSYTLHKSLVAMLTYCIVDSSSCGARAGANRRGHHALHVHGDGVVGEGARQQVVRFAVERKRPECKDHLLDCQVVRVRSTPTMLPWLSFVLVAHTIGDTYAWPLCIDKGLARQVGFGIPARPYTSSAVKPWSCVHTLSTMRGSLYTDARVVWVPSLYVLKCHQLWGFSSWIAQTHTHTNTHTHTHIHTHTHTYTHTHTHTGRARPSHPSTRS